MSLQRVNAKRDFRAFGRAMRNALRGWDEQDIVSLSERLYNPAAFNGGILKITQREYRALPEFNRRVMASTKGAMLFPFLAWVEGRGLRPLQKAG